MPENKRSENESKDCAVEIEQLEKKFGHFTAVNKISFKVQTGLIYGFLGPNGAGKSTTIRMLCGILAPTSGKGSVGGFDIYTQTEKIKAHIGYMSQKFSLYEDLTVEENINFYSGIYGIPKSKKKERKEWAIRMAGLEERRHAKTAILPGGWKQRLALGCAVLHEPSILFLDEPTAGVDPINRRKFWDLIYQLSEKRVTVFVTTHYMDEAEYFDKMALIYQGDIIASGTPRGLKQAMKDQVLEVSCDRPEEALEALREEAVVKEAALFGKDLHIVADEEMKEKNVIGDYLKKKGFSVQAISRIVPSLEDVFVSLIESHDKGQNR